jgi:hypothetical protein
VFFPPKRVFYWFQEYLEFLTFLVFLEFFQVFWKIHYGFAHSVAPHCGDFGSHSVPYH